MTHSQPLPWHPIPTGRAACKVYLMQAGSLYIPEDMTLLPGPNQPNELSRPDHTANKSKSLHVPDYVFLIEHTSTNNKYLFDLGMRKDVENLPPYLIKNVLPQFTLEPESPADILKEHGTSEQQPENVNAVIFSHMHFDHVGDGAKAGFADAEMWVGPTCCTYARPGYPVDENSPTLSETLPVDGTKKIIESYISDDMFKEAGDKRAGKVEEAVKKGKYTAVDLKKPRWIGLGSFDRAYDVFDDGSAYLIDAPGHSAGHQIMLIRTKYGSSFDTFVLLAGDCFHHPDILKDPRRTARPPYSKSCMHSNPEQAIDDMWRTRKFAEQENIWVLAAHDFTIGESIVPGQKKVGGLVQVNDWFEKGWKKPIQASI